MTAVIIRLEKFKTAKRELSSDDADVVKEEPKRMKLDTEEECKTSASA